MGAIDIGISLEWHRILGLGEKDAKPLQQMLLKEIMSQYYLGREEIYAIGRGLYKKFSIGTLKHSHMLYDTCNSVSDILVVSLTGSEKSNAFKFPILVEKKVKSSFRWFH